MNNILGLNTEQEIHKILPMYGKSMYDASKVILDLIQNKIDTRKTFTIVLSSDGGKTIWKHRLNKKDVEKCFYDDVLKYFIVERPNHNKRYLMISPNEIVNIY